MDASSYLMGLDGLPGGFCPSYESCLVIMGLS